MGRERFPGRIVELVGFELPRIQTRQARPFRVEEATIAESPLPEARPYRDVADRFRYLLSAVGLSREEFAAALSGAIEPRSLFSLLSGSRRPSRALAVLIERTWGFRADYLLRGEGETWAKSDTEIRPGLSVEIAAVVAFMENSPENARSMMSHLEQAQAWTRLFGRLFENARALNACGRSGSDENLLAYPVFAKLLFEDLAFMAARYEELVLLLLRRQEQKLIDIFLHRFVEELPRSVLGEEEQGRLSSMLTPVLEHRREALRALDESIRRARATIDNICELGPMDALVRERCGQAPLVRRRALVGRLSALAPQELRNQAEALVEELDAESQPSSSYWTGLQRLLRDLLSQLDTPPQPLIDTCTLEDLRVRCEALLDPLA